MDRVDGILLNDLFQDPSMSDEALTLFCRLFVELHALDWKLLEPDNPSVDFDNPLYHINRTLDRYEERILHYGHRELLPIIEWLRRGAGNVPCNHPSITHGDFHPLNILLDNARNPYVIDWTTARVTDYRIDLAWTLLLSGTFVNRQFRDAIIRRYEEIAEMKVHEIEYFEVISILRRLSDISISFRESAEELGMRADAVDMMKTQIHHIRNVYSWLQEYTGIKISEIEQLIEEMSQ
jgi:aminoglycoside phosphotransferase (APT) family kinase protein